MIHLVEYLDDGKGGRTSKSHTACGTLYDDPSLVVTTDPNKVTCERCLLAMREPVKARAVPLEPKESWRGVPTVRVRVEPPEMTLRDWFAGKALQGLLANTNFSSEEQCANLSYRQADAMLAERAKEQK